MRFLKTGGAEFNVNYFTLRLAGDFNDDGQVSLADYTVWRDILGRGDRHQLVGRRLEWCRHWRLSTLAQNYVRGTPVPRQLSLVPEPSAEMMLWIAVQIALVVWAAPRFPGRLVCECMQATTFQPSHQ